MKRIRNSKHQATLNLPTIQLEGSLFLPDQLEKAAQGRAQGQTEVDYGVPKGVKLKDEYSRAFQIACAQWQHFAAQLDRVDVDAHRLTVGFLSELLRDALGYAPIQSATSVQVGAMAYPVNVMAGLIAVLVAPHNLALDDADPRFAVAGSGNRKKSAFQAMQELLNASPEHTWGIVSNGKQLRLLRDAASLTRPTYLEFDLADLLGGQRYAEFANVWRLLHGSRAPQSGGAACVWEQWREAGKAEGTRVRDGLRNGVEKALLTFGEGFLLHPANDALRAALHDGSLCKDAYFQQLLRLIYRLIFVFTVEERGVLHPVDDSAEALAARKAYAGGYALSRLRELCLKRHARNRHDDHWQAVRIVWRGLAHGQARLALPALGGLFAEDQCPQLDTASLHNTHMLAALQHLRWAVIIQGKTSGLTPVDYRNMGPEELGSVYESLLELVPTIDLPARRFGFVGITEEGNTAGNARKTSGSYYTPDSLVQELIKSALDPIIEQRLQARPDNPTEALLSVRVMDPACGSGHFLLAAARRLAEKLAQLRSLQGGQEGAVKPQDYRHALRDVVARCIYGVDRNPMAIELARTALWLEGFEEGRPLGFLDHHLQVGDALLGLTDLKALELGIAKEAFKPMSGDDKEVCKHLAKINGAALKDLTKKRDAKAFGQMDVTSQSGSGLTELQALEALPEDSTAQIAAKADAYGAYLQQARTGHLAQAAHLLLGAYLLPKRADTAGRIPTTATLYLSLQGVPLPADQQGALAAAQAACDEARVLHWPLAFPQVFAQGGFDCVLGNPPWEVSQLGEEEFFATRAPHISELAGERRKRAIASLELDNPRLWQAYINESQRVSATNNFFRESGRYPLTAIGKLNSYPLFSETICQIIKPMGRGGFIVPSGIGTDNSTKSFFQSLVNGKRLISFFGFDNAKRIFPAVHPDTPFALVTVGTAPSNAELAHYLLSVEHLLDPRRRFRLTAAEFQLINPNTLTCPVFRSERDAELTKKLYGTAPVLIDEGRADGNPWDISFSQGLFNMTSDSRLFRETPGSDLLPLYEAKLVHHFDHRWSTYTPGATSRDVGDTEKADPAYMATTRYWVSKVEVEQRLQEKNWERKWLMGWRDITNATNERTVIASVIPRVGVGNQMPLMLFGGCDNHRLHAALLANLCALTFDFVARHKTGGTHMNYFIYKQLPVLPPERYTEADLAIIVPRVLELTYTAHDLRAWAQDLDFDGAPFAFDPQRRAEMRAELDAYYARLYGLTRDELRYILDPVEVLGEDYPSETFRVLKNREMKEFNEYRTQRLVLREFDRMALAEANDEPYISLLHPPPGVQVTPSYTTLGVIRDDADAHLAGLMLTIIQQAGRIPRRELTQALTLAARPELQSSFLNTQGLSLIRAFEQSHPGVFDSSRLAGGRMHQWTRHFETLGVIRLHATNDLVEHIQTVDLPAYALVTADTVPVAAVLAQAAAQALAVMTEADQGTSTITPSIKQA
jgi:hypothetical protein